MIFDNERNEFDTDHAAFRNRFRRRRMREHKQQRFKEKQAQEKTFDDFELDFHVDKELHQDRPYHEEQPYYDPASDMDELEENEIDFTDWDDDVGEVKDFDSDDSERHFRSKDHDNVKDTKNA